ncbi:hypothetical protein TSMEX_006463 [Taenia solium]|eukprot:TsM_001186500 transcript=TsM_001186500 gene=TsM_001186500
MSQKTQRSNSRCERKDDEEREESSTLRQGVQLLLRALQKELFLAVVNAGITADSYIDHCCETLAQLAIDQREQSLAREFFHQDQKAGEDDEEYARNLQRLAERAFRSCNQEASGTPPDTDDPGVQLPAKPDTSTLDFVAPYPKSK